MINGEVIAEAILQIADSHILKTKGKITLPPVSVLVIGIKMPTLCNTNHVYELNFETFQLSEGVILLDVLHKVDCKTTKSKHCNN